MITDETREKLEREVQELKRTMPGFGTLKGGTIIGRPAVATSQIIAGMEKGELPSVKNRYNQWLSEQLNKNNDKIKKYHDIMMQMHKEEREGYAEKAPAGAQRDLEFEFGKRRSGLYRTGFELSESGKIVQKNEEERFRKYEPEY